MKLSKMVGLKMNHHHHPAQTAINHLNCSGKPDTFLRINLLVVDALTPGLVATSTHQTITAVIKLPGNIIMLVQTVPTGNMSISLEEIIIFSKTVVGINHVQTITVS